MSRPSRILSFSPENCNLQSTGARRFWFQSAATIAMALIAVGTWLYSPNRDHIGAIAMNGDGSWFYNDEPGIEMQDSELLNHLKSFNLDVASFYSGESYLKVIQKWHLHPTLFVANADRDIKDFQWLEHSREFQSAFPKH